MAKWRNTLLGLVSLIVLATLAETQPTTTISRFPRFTTAGRPACGTTRAGHPYFDTTTNDAWICDGTAYVLLSGGAAACDLGAGAGVICLDTTNSRIIGEGETADAAELFINFNDGQFVLLPGESQANGAYSFTQVPAAGFSGTLFEASGTLNAMDAAGGDIVNVLSVALTNADHTGGTLNGVNVGVITGDAQATENGIKVGGGWDVGLDLSALTAAYTTIAVKLPQIAAIEWSPSGTSEGQLVTGARTYVTNTINGAYVYTLEANGGTGGEVTWRLGADLAVVGAAQNINPLSTSVEIGAAAAASVTTITAPPVSAAANGQTVHLICKDANVTINDSDGAGAANTINLAGAATNFVCSADDVLTLTWIASPGAGNNRWTEVGRSVN